MKKKNNLDKPFFYFDESVFNSVLSLLFKQGYSLQLSVDRDSLCHAFVNHSWPDFSTAVFFVKSYLK